MPLYSVKESLELGDKLETNRLNRKVIQQGMDDETEARSLRSQIVGGDQTALPKFISLDPKAAGELMGALRGMTEDQRKEEKARNDVMTKALLWTGMQPKEGEPTEFGQRGDAAIDHLVKSGFQEAEQFRGKVTPQFVQQRLLESLDVNKAMEHADPAWKPSGSPTFTKDAEGNTVPVTTFTNKNGEIIERVGVNPVIKDPNKEGASLEKAAKTEILADGTIIQATGDGQVRVTKANQYQAADVAAGRQAGVELKVGETQGKATARETGKAQGEAITNYGKVIDGGNKVLQQLTALKAHPGKKYGIGFYGKVPAAGGTDLASFKARMEEIVSGAFVTGVGSAELKGALSDAEGKKLQAATTRMSVSQSHAEFDAAVDEYTQTIRQVMRRISKAKEGDFSPASEGPDAVTTTPVQPVSQPQQAGPSIDDLVNKYAK